MRRKEIKKLNFFLALEHTIQQIKCTFKIRYPPSHTLYFDSCPGGVKKLKIYFQTTRPISTFLSFFVGVGKGKKYETERSTRN